MLILLPHDGGNEGTTDLIPWIIAAILVIADIVTLVWRRRPMRVVLIIAGASWSTRYTLFDQGGEPTYPVHPQLGGCP